MSSTAQGYASEQPAHFKNRIENVAIVGAGGQSGKFIVEAMLKTGAYKVTAVTRKGSTNKLPEGVLAKEVDYNDHSSLVAALQGQDALVITMAVTAPPDQQSKLIEAAAEANVPWVVPNEFGVDGQGEAGKDSIIGPMKAAEREHIERLGKSSWIGISCGFWYEFSLGGNEYRYGFDFLNRTVTFFDEGTTRMNTSTWPQVARSVANLLALKILPDDANDKSPSLSSFRNKFVYVSSFLLNQQEMFESVQRVTGTGPDDWKARKVPVTEWFQEGKDLLAKGNPNGFTQQLYSRYFFPDSPGNFEATNGLDNDKLGLPKDSLDEFTKKAIEMAESGYYDFERQPPK